MEKEKLAKLEQVIEIQEEAEKHMQELNLKEFKDCIDLQWAFFLFYSLWKIFK